ncbi:DUF3467 domain-containing protein [Vulgatibacter incomptus]|uniref:DUF3467 domain-containing protein n=1 Tax=Vulgatibacter incomptus TaxID=1391653 RepID=A0A0K1PGQ6_9BACT|nr:DUF3467 domain-containing protein [Vulgatibacter incomptus]AKU92294.1 hypothetical protein AKJ08_2681 [Vulgatibacter incomptus]
MSDKPTNHDAQQLEIQIDEDTAQGVYANLATVTHNPTEFVLDFIYVQPQQPKAKVRSRVITSPLHLKRLLLALQENVARYEKRFGPIEGGGEPDLPVH